MDIASFDTSKDIWIISSVDVQSIHLNPCLTIRLRVVLWSVNVGDISTPVKVLKKVEEN